MASLDFSRCPAIVPADGFIRDGIRMYGVIQPCVSDAASDGGKHGGCNDERRRD